MATVDARPIIAPGGEPFETIMAAVAELEAVEERVEVEDRVMWDSPWSPTKIDEDAAYALGFRAR
ncbi:MAG: hypothetical protein ACRDYZ_16860 [Acidimicrobiales bacterium]